MIYHVFNSSLISGPETLVMPAIANLNPNVMIILLREERIARDKQSHVEIYMKDLGLQFQVVDVSSRFDKKAILELKQLLERAGKKLEVAHAHDVKASFYLYMASRSLRDRPFAIVSTHHGVDGRAGLMNRAYEMFYSYLILPRYDLVLCVCSQDRESLIERGLDEKKVKVHLNGVTRVRISAPARSSRRKMIHEAWGLQGDTEDVCILGVAARLEPEKRPFEFLRVAETMSQLDPKFHFKILIFGRGSLESQLRAETQRRGLQGKVLWMGYRSGLGDEFAGFDLLLSLSKAEGLPINLLEAGWAGTPVFATAVNGVKDLISSEALGELIHRDEETPVIARKLIHFSKNRSELERKGNSFQNHVVEKFSQEVWLNNLLKFYKELSAEDSKTEIGL